MGAIYIEGLVDACDTDDFDAKESLLMKSRNSAVASMSDIEDFCWLVPGL